MAGQFLSQSKRSRHLRATVVDPSTAFLAKPAVATVLPTVVVRSGPMTTLTVYAILFPIGVVFPPYELHGQLWRRIEDPVDYAPMIWNHLARYIHFERPGIN
jgi:hypothetical protein